MRTALTVALFVVALGGCQERDLAIPRPSWEVMPILPFPQTLETKVDILFVIDNSGSMEQEQTNLAAQFPRLIEALRHEGLGDRIPDVHIGVVTTDLGAGSFPLATCEVANGDGGKLQTRAGAAGCKTPSDPWIAYDYSTDKTNIVGCEGDGIECVKNAFSCIAQVGIEGCGFESPLEAARRALDPKLNLNKGFLREDALLAIVFITDEDDCSAKNPQLFDPSPSLIDKLGPLGSFRCFEFGVQCDINDRNKTGERKNCKPVSDYLYSVDGYISFFRGLKKSKDRVIVAAIAGPLGPVAVGKAGQNPELQPSCQSSTGFAVPALRLGAVVTHLGGKIDPICDEDFGPALAGIGKRIRSALGSQCVTRPLLTREPRLACLAGMVFAEGQRCESSNLDEADCSVEEQLGGDAARRVEIPRCPTELFDATRKSCGGHCPCWRILPRPDKCGPKSTTFAKTTPFGFDVMHAREPEKGTIAIARCRALTLPWGDARLADYL